MDMKCQKWGSRILELAKTVASWSKDDSTKVGAVITTSTGKPISWGFNGMPMGIDDTIPERMERPLKYKWMCHAERNAIDLASQADLSDCIMFVTFSPCPNCAQSIIQKGIKTIVVDAEFTAEKMPERWQADMTIATEMFAEAGVEIIAIYPDEVHDQNKGSGNN
jgi:dCMP deaminase